MTNYVSTLNVLLYGEPIATITNVGNDRTLFALWIRTFMTNRGLCWGLALKMHLVACFVKPSPDCPKVASRLPLAVV